MILDPSGKINKKVVIQIWMPQIKHGFFCAFFCMPILPDVSQEALNLLLRHGW
jgi:hypothetical protein